MPMNDSAVGANWVIYEGHQMTGMYFSSAGIGGFRSAAFA